MSCRRAENILIAFYCLTASSQQCSGRVGGNYKNLFGTNKDELAFFAELWARSNQTPNKIESSADYLILFLL